MSQSLVEVSEVEETVTEVLAQLVRDCDEQAQSSVERLQKQVELHLEYSGGSLSRWKNWITSRIGSEKICSVPE